MRFLFRQRSGQRFVDRWLVQSGQLSPFSKGLCLDRDEVPGESLVRSSSDQQQHSRWTKSPRLERDGEKTCQTPKDRMDLFA